MSPVDDFLKQLLATCPTNPVLPSSFHLFHVIGHLFFFQTVSLFSCGHIIPRTNVCALAVSRGPAGTPLSFKHDTRANAQVCARCDLQACVTRSHAMSQILAELADIIVRICALVDDGIVVFFPSYAYEELVYADWQARGTLANIEVWLQALLT